MIRILTAIAQLIAVLLGGIIMLAAMMLAIMWLSDVL